MIQLRNVPDDLHRRLKARAAMEGMSLSDYLIAEVARVADRPTPREMLDRLHTRTPVEPRVPPVEAVRAARDAR
jgi:plasmid stability protein